MIVLRPACQIFQMNLTYNFPMSVYFILQNYIISQAKQYHSWRFGEIIYKFISNVCLVKYKKIQNNVCWSRKVISPTHSKPVELFSLIFYWPKLIVNALWSTKPVLMFNIIRCFVILNCFKIISVSRKLTKYNIYILYNSIAELMIIHYS